MRIDWVVPCRYVEVHEGEATIVGAGADLHLLSSLPTAVQVLFAVRYVGAPGELDGETEHPIALRIFDPGGGLIAEQRGHLKAHSTQIVPGYVADLMVPTGIVLEPREYGTYHFEFSIDQDQGTVPIHFADPADLLSS